MGNKKEQSAIVPDKTLVEKMVSEYELLRNQEKQISERKKVLADAIKSYAFANGTKDDSGSFYSDNDTFTYGAQCKKSVKFDVDKASKFLQSKGFVKKRFRKGKRNAWGFEGIRMKKTWNDGTLEQE